MNSDYAEQIRRLRILASDRRYADVVAEIKNSKNIDFELATTLVAELSEYGGIEWVHPLFDLGASLDGANREGRTPLASCIFGVRDRYETFPLFVELLFMGADPNLPAEQGYLPLQLAIEMNLPEYAIALLVMGADPSRSDNTFEHGSAEKMLEKAIPRELYWARELVRRWNRGNSVNLRNRVIP